MKTLSHRRRMPKLAQTIIVQLYFLASPDRCPEYVSVLTVVVSELELSDVQMKIFLANLVIGAHDATLQDGPEAFNRIGVNRANDMLANSVIDGLVREAVLQTAIAWVSIGAKQANAVRYGFPHKSFKRVPVSALDNASNDVSFALDRANDSGLASISAPARSAFLVPMPVLVAAADIGLINFNNSAKFLDVLDHGGSDLVAHEPSSFVASEAHITEDLEGAHALFADKHQVGDSVPIFQRLIRVLKDCAGQVREAIAVHSTDFALPMMAGSERIDFSVAAARTGDPLGPPANYQIRNAIVLSLKQRVELRRCHLMD
jgi:hypothetical protein